MPLLNTLEDTVSSWPQISVHPHQFSAREFRFGKAEVGHVHDGGIVDIPFPRSLRDALLAEGLAEEHHWFLIQDGLHFGFEATKTYSTPYG